MKWRGANFLGIGRPPAVTLALLIGVILAGNGLTILQFERTRRQADRLTGVSQQLIAILRLQDIVLSSDQRLNELARSKDAPRLIEEAKPLETALVEQTRAIRTVFAYLPPEIRVDPAFLAALNTVEFTLPSQLQDVAGMAGAGDWDAVRLRLDTEFKRLETTASALVKSLQRDVDEQLPVVVANMGSAERRMLILVPATAIFTVLIAALFGWTMARRILELRLEERVSERTRIARDLHDTLLQSFQGVLLKFYAVSYLIPDRPEEAQQTLDGAIEEARQAIAEGRDAVQGLRSSPVLTEDLGRALSTFGEGLAANSNGASRPEFQVRVEGTPRSLAPVVRDEVYRIAGEGLRNAFRHSGARRIEVNIDYDKRRLRLRVRDDGKGIDPKVLDAGGRAGHHGLPGMQERARLAGGKLAVWSQSGSGTEIELTISAAIAYAKSAITRQEIAQPPMNAD